MSLVKSCFASKLTIKGFSFFVYVWMTSHSDQLMVYAITNYIREMLEDLVLTFNKLHSGDFKWAVDS